MKVMIMQPPYPREQRSVPSVAERQQKIPTRSFSIDLCTAIAPRAEMYHPVKETPEHRLVRQRAGILVGGGLCTLG